MGYHNPRQKDNVAAVMYGVTPGASQAAITQARMPVKIYKDGDDWKVRDNTTSDNTSPTTISTDYYDPPFHVRWMKVEGQSHQVKYDSPGPDDEVRYNLDLFAVETLHRIQVTRIWLDADTTVDAITLYE